ncbi:MULTISPECIES: PorP/SprF family type IX secretion system membrane protein [Flavobacterium]|uniref:PorP/SprF family type IX secretion system membrane protein n=1 Tax=Flavobacterium TaxID=237 RepID=UPI001FCAC7E2|nr:MULTISPECIES: type IX secretion system membrane protein PorP/SprF [Flavobacterium]UOK41809.1 type IX secretion system membrane protein PorP/SprF [Flavobacterium enshiense]
MKTKLITLVLGLIGMMGYAQQDSQYTQYMYNTISINPAYAGSREVLSIFGLYRTQWVGLDGAPETMTFSVNSPISDSSFGVGLSFVNDKIGPASESAISADLSYYLQISDNYKLAFGVKGTANLFNIDVNKLRIENPDDTRFQNLDNDFTGNVGVGFYLYSDKFYAGLSIPYWLETNHYKDNSVSITKEKRHYYFITGYVFDVGSNLKIKPSILAKAAEGAPFQGDASLNFLIYDKLTLGAAYRWDAAWSAMAGFQISNSLFAGYAYDMETTDLKNYNDGSHEIFLRWELFNNSKMLTPRFF